MRDFQESYLSLLKEQVEQEIYFLLRQGHDTDKISNPCIFCSPRQGYHVCYRLNELRRFQSQIVQHESLRSRVARNVPKERRKIGWDAVNSNEPMSYQGNMLTPKQVIQEAVKQLGWDNPIETNSEPFDKIFG